MQIKHFDNDGATVISSQDWANMFAGTTATARKFAFRNVDIIDWAGVQLQAIAVGDSDGIDIARWALDTATLSPPFNVASVAASGGSFAAGTFYYVVTAFNATGETIASFEVSSVAASGDKVTVSWDEISGASGYRLYRSTTAGTYGASSKVGSDITPGSTTSVEDSGSATGTGTPATTNTTGGVGPNYGTAPALGVIAVAVGTVEIGRMVFYWVNRVASAGMVNEGNPRLWDIEIAET